MGKNKFLFVLKRKWWIIVLFLIIGVCAGFLSIYFAKPNYEADTKLYIIKNVNNSLNLDDFTVSQYLVQQSTDIIQSRAVTSAILKDVDNYNITEKQLMLMIHVVTNKDSNIFTIYATSNDPTVAAAVANATAHEYTARLRQITNSDDSVGILDEAVVPKQPVPNHQAVKILLGALFGLMIAGSIIFITEYFDTNIYSAEDITNGLNLQVIGIIPEHDIR